MRQGAWPIQDNLPISKFLTSRASAKPFPPCTVTAQSQGWGGRRSQCFGISSLFRDPFAFLLLSLGDRVVNVELLGQTNAGAKFLGLPRFPP